MPSVVREHRERLGLSKIELAHRAGISRFRLTMHELRGDALTDSEKAACARVFLAETQRLAKIAEIAQEVLQRAAAV